MNNINNSNYTEIPAEMFELANRTDTQRDKKLETKPIGYFKDAWIRFSKNKGSVVAACIILFLVLYAIIGPIAASNSYTQNPTDTTYLHFSKLYPKCEALSFLGWDGCKDATLNKATYNYYNAIYVETGCNPIADVYKDAYKEEGSLTGAVYYDVSLDTYYSNGMLYLTLTKDQYEDIQAWQDENGIQVIYPAITDATQTDANIWYEADQKGTPVTRNGKYTDIYKTYGEDGGYHSLRIEGDDGSYRYAHITGDSAAISYKVRVFKYNYFQYRYGFEPSFLFGTNAYGQDIFTRLAGGARFSFIFAICISVINMVIGIIYGSIEGYYGGAVDMTLERISDMLNNVPFVVVTTLFQLHLASKVGVVPALLFAFVSTGWIGMASTVRMQFYRFKGQEYTLAARTLGASDTRLMFKHIFPNSLGTIVTGAVLVIPGVIFSESSLTYLNIVNLDSTTRSSVGSMLANGRAYFTTDPYIIFFPALFISLLEISFNLFGNGLRDAFNPSLRGAED